MKSARSARNSPDVLGRRALNRALLARQLLLCREKHSVAATIERLVGQQAQIPENPYLGLWSRLAVFRPEQLSRLIATRKAVRLALMRSTIHLVTARDCLALRPLVQPVLERSFAGNHGKRLAGADLKAIAANGRRLVEEKPRTFAELGAALRERWPERDAPALAQAVRTFVPLVQIPPRGLWGGSGQPTHASAEHWLGKPPARSASLDDLVLRYLAAFGPATVRDAQTWSALTRLDDVFERLRPRLRVFRDEAGRELFDLPRARRPDPDTPAPVRFLPEYDNVLLGHADRSRIIADEHRKYFLGANGNFFGTVLVDGFVAARWRIDRGTKARSNRATLVVETFAPLAPSDRNDVADEGARLLAFAAADAESSDMRFAKLR